jgi:hypothetical protein
MYKLLELFIEHGVEGAVVCACLFLGILFLILFWEQLDLDIWVGQAIRVHGWKVLGFVQRDDYSSKRRRCLCVRHIQADAPATLSVILSAHGWHIFLATLMHIEVAIW